MKRLFKLLCGCKDVKCMENMARIQRLVVKGKGMVKVCRWQVADCLNMLESRVK